MICVIDRWRKLFRMYFVIILMKIFIKVLLFVWLVGIGGMFLVFGSIGGLWDNGLILFFGFIWLRIVCVFKYKLY